MVGRQRLRRRLRPDVRQKIHMHTAGMIIAILGGVLLFGTSLALSCIKTNDKPSAAETFDLFILGGVFGFFGDLFRAIAEGFRNRSSPAFPPLILFGVSLMLLAVGGALLMMDGS
mgnify:CR=1|jgi:hypothetical protein